MTEKEAIKYLDIMKACAEDGSVGELQKQMCETAIQALEEIRQYREIGTVEECREAREKLPVAEEAIRKLLCSNKLPNYEAVYERLREYEKAEENGRLLELPCKVGDTVYILARRYGNFYEEDICDGFYMGRDGVLKIKVLCYKGNHGTYGTLNETVFLTKEAVETALKEMRND